MGLKSFFMAYPKSVFRTFWLVVVIGLASVILHNLFSAVPWLEWVGVPFFFIGVAAMLPLVIMLTLLKSTTGLVIGVIINIFYLIFVAVAIVALRKLKKEQVAYKQQLEECRAKPMETKVNRILTDSLPSPKIKRKKTKSPKTKKRKTTKKKSSR